MYTCGRCKNPEARDVDLVQCVQRRGDCYDWASKCLIDRYHPLIRAALRRLANLYGGGRLQYCDADDAEEGGRVGVLTAARNFLPAKGVPFAAFAAPHVHGTARRFLFAAWGRSTSGQARPVELVDEVDPDSTTTMSVEDQVSEFGFGLGDAAAAVSALTPDHQSLVEALYISGFSLSDLARERAVARQSLSAQHRRVLRILKGLLPDQRPDAA